MTAKRTPARDAGLPIFAIPRKTEADVSASPFDLSSHARAREALAFGLGVDSEGFNIFVVGEGRSGRMTSTRSYLESHFEVERLVRYDWVYLNNFRRPHQPIPFRLPGGDGSRLRHHLSRTVREIHVALNESFRQPQHANLLREAGMRLPEDLASEAGTLESLARAKGIDLQITARGTRAIPLDAEGNARAHDDLTLDEQRAFETAIAEIQDALGALNKKLHDTQLAAQETTRRIRRQIASQAIASSLDELMRSFTGVDGLTSWMVELREDILDHVESFLGSAPGDPAPGAPELLVAQARYAVNLLVDNSDDCTKPVILEPNPSYQNLFGVIEYRNERGVLVTDFSMIRAGALHRANGGVLVLRADALGKNPESWEFLKGALRDEEIRIEEGHKSGAAPLTAAPKPIPIPLDIKLVLIGSYDWYYRLLNEDPEFPDYFKVKAEIDTTMEASACNIDVFARLIRQASLVQTATPCDDKAVAALLGMLSRWATDRTKLAARFELIDDLLAEATAGLLKTGTRVISSRHVKSAVLERRRRNSGVEDRSQKMIGAGQVLIRTGGSAIGEINGLTVRRAGNHVFGLPAKVTARAYVGDQGVVNIDRLTGHGGPIQQKGMFILGGFLHGLFSSRFPISFSATVTFEQTYTGVEGDSASLAELCALLSSLSDLPARQDLAITGSVNQVGEAQVIGDLHHKIEGFFRTCEQRGLSGSQGVIYPRANNSNLVLRDEVVEAIRQKNFHLWSVDNVDEAIELFTGVRAGRQGRDGRFSSGSVYDRVAKKLESYDVILKDRA